MISELRRLAKSRDLLYMLTWRDIRVRYKQSLMGFLWAILMPALVVGAGVFVRIAAASWSGTAITSEAIASVMVRAVVWSFFIASIRFSTSSLISNPNLVTKIAFPKEVFPISAVLSNLFDFAVAAVAVAAILVVAGWTPSLHALWVFPLLLTLLALTVGMAFILSAANLFFRDVKYLVEVFLTYAIFFTPVIYDAGDVGKWKNVLLLNPVAPLLEGVAGSVILATNPDLLWTLYSLIFSIGLLVFGYWLFKQLEEQFAEAI